MLKSLLIIINQEIFKNKIIKIIYKKYNQVDWHLSEVINLEIYQFLIQIYKLQIIHIVCVQNLGKIMKGYHNLLIITLIYKKIIQMW